MNAKRLHLQNLHIATMSVAQPEKLQKFLNKRVHLKINHGREVVMKLKLHTNLLSQWRHIELRWRGSFKALMRS